MLNTADPHHHRQPSLGELHQELENEQEAQVNRLLHMIRMQQDQIAQMQRQQQNAQQEPSPTSTEQTRFPTPPSNLQTPGTNITDPSSPRSSSIPGLPHAHGHFNRPHSLSRQSSARMSNAGTNSRGGSPAFPPAANSIGPLTEDFLLGGTRDECAFYQAETQMLTRENQMLKLRIRELGKHLCSSILGLRWVAELGETRTTNGGCDQSCPAQRRWCQWAIITQSRSELSAREPACNFRKRVCATDSRGGRASCEGRLSPEKVLLFFCMLILLGTFGEELAGWDFFATGMIGKVLGAATSDWGSKGGRLYMEGKCQMSGRYEAMILG